MTNHLCLRLAGLLLMYLPLAAAADADVLKFRTMVGVSGSFLGSSNPIRGLNGGGRPWVLNSANGELSNEGKLKVKVKGLIIPLTEGSQFGRNPVAFFRAIISCISEENGLLLPA